MRPVDRKSASTPNRAGRYIGNPRADLRRLSPTFIANAQYGPMRSSVEALATALGKGPRPLSDSSTLKPCGADARQRVNDEAPGFTSRMEAEVDGCSPYRLIPSSGRFGSGKVSIAGQSWNFATFAIL